jgi:sugar/nucleoside kinase (ribokinase family)
VIVDQSHERTMFPDRGANAHLDEVDLAPLRALPPRRVHVSGYALLGEGSREAARSVLAWARDVGATVSVDAASAAPLQAVGAETFLGWVEGVDELFANDDEVAALGGVGRILRSCRVLVHKHGKRGATWDNGRLQHAVAARDVVAVDSTGAGDAFAAGWLAASIRGADVPACLRAASDLAAQAVTVVGARPHRP